MDQGTINLAYQRLAAAIPEGVNKGEALRAACRLVADIINQFNEGTEKENNSVYTIAIGIIKAECEIFRIIR